MDRQDRVTGPDEGTPDAGNRRLDTFVRGLLSGALVGAAIAGSAIWERRRRKKPETAVGALEPALAVDSPEA